MRKNGLPELYKLMFPEYPDIVTVKDLTKMLGISRTKAYELIADGDIQAVMIGITYKIPKVSVINFVTREKNEETGSRGAAKIMQ